MLTMKNCVSVKKNNTVVLYLYPYMNRSGNNNNKNALVTVTAQSYKLAASPIVFNNSIAFLAFATLYPIVRVYYLVYKTGGVKSYYYRFIMCTTMYNGDKYIQLIKIVE